MFMRRTQDPLYEYQKRRLLDATISLSHIATIEFKWKIGAFFFLFLEWEKKGGYFSPLWVTFAHYNRLLTSLVQNFFLKYCTNSSRCCSLQGFPNCIPILCKMVQPHCFLLWRFRIFTSSFWFLCCCWRRRRRWWRRWLIRFRWRRRRCWSCKAKGWKSCCLQRKKGSKGSKASS